MTSRSTVYILRLPNSRLYVGMSKDPARRLKYHKQSKGAKFTKNSKNLKLVFTEHFTDIASAMLREKQIKGWTKVKKEALVKGDFDLLKSL